MSDEEQVQQALAELWDVVKCRCNEAYTGRGLHDPDCECDSTDALQIVTGTINALTEQLTAARDDAKEAEAYAEELEAKVKSLTKHHANMADPRYWEGRYRDEKNLLTKVVEGQKIKALEQILEERGAVFDAMVDAAEEAAGKDVSFNVVVGRALRAAIAEIKGESHD